jgi:DNA-binding LytR/AlgR family response regulator
MNPTRNIVKKDKKGVALYDIILLEANSNYTKVYFLNGHCITLALTLKTLEKRFTEVSLFRTHKSYLVNLAFCKEVHWHDERPFITMCNDYRAAISRRNRSKLRKRLKAISNLTQ